jgi:organic radical activating enzyme
MLPKLYEVSEVFLSIQGEGSQVGFPAVFVRFSGCNLNCDFCDTKGLSSVDLTEDELVDLIVSKCGGISDKPPLRCIFTGGEPFIQLDHALVRRLHNMGFIIGAETNGSVPPEGFDVDTGGLFYLDELTLSPKTKDVNHDILRHAQQLKVLYPLGLSLPVIDGLAALVGSAWPLEPRFILQPITPREGVDSMEFRENCRFAMHLAYDWFREKGQIWRVIPQVHRCMGLR